MKTNAWRRQREFGLGIAVMAAAMMASRRWTNDAADDNPDNPLNFLDENDATGLPQANDDVTVDEVTHGAFAAPPTLWGAGLNSVSITGTFATYSSGITIKEGGQLTITDVDWRINLGAAGHPLSQVAASGGSTLVATIYAADIILAGSTANSGTLNGGTTASENSSLDGTVNGHVTMAGFAVGAATINGDLELQDDAAATATVNGNVALESNTCHFNGSATGLVSFSMSFLLTQTQLPAGTNLCLDGTFYNPAAINAGYASGAITNLAAGNVKSGVTIAGVNGTYDQTGNDAAVAAAQLATDVAAVTAKQNKILRGTTILGVAGTAHGRRSIVS